MKKTFVLLMSVCALMASNTAKAAEMPCGGNHVYDSVNYSYTTTSNYSHTHYTTDRNGVLMPMNCIVAEIRHYKNMSCVCGSKADVLFSVDHHHSVN